MFLMVANLPMTKNMAKCDISGEILDTEEDIVYSVTVLKRDTDKNGRRRLMKFEFDSSATSFSPVLELLKGSKVLSRWQIYVAPTKEEKKDGGKGHWERVE